MLLTKCCYAITFTLVSHEILEPTAPSKSHQQHHSCTHGLPCVTDTHTHTHTHTKACTRTHTQTIPTHTHTHTHTYECRHALDKATHNTRHQSHRNKVLGVEVSPHITRYRYNAASTFDPQQLHYTEAAL